MMMDPYAALFASSPPSPPPDDHANHHNNHANHDAIQNASDSDDSSSGSIYRSAAHPNNNNHTAATAKVNGRRKKAGPHHSTGKGGGPTAAAFAATVSDPAAAAGGNSAALQQQQQQNGAAAPTPTNDPRALDRDTKRLLMGLMFPCVEVVSGIVLDRFIDFDADTIVLRSLVDSTTAGGALTVLSVQNAEQVSVVHYKDTNFYHVTVDGVSRALCAPTAVHLHAIPDVHKTGMPTFALYDPKDDIGARIAALSAENGGIMPPKDTSVNAAAGGGDIDGFKIPSLVSRRAGILSDGAVTLASLLQQNPLFRTLIGPNTTVAEVEARFASMMAFSTNTQFIEVPTMHSVVSLPLSTSRYIADMMTLRRKTLQQEEERMKRNKSGIIGAARQGGSSSSLSSSSAFYQSIVKKSSKRANNEASGKEGARGSIANGRYTQFANIAGNAAQTSFDQQQHSLIMGVGGAAAEGGYSEKPQRNRVGFAEASLNALLDSDEYKLHARSGGDSDADEDDEREGDETIGFRKRSADYHFISTGSELLHTAHVPPIQFAVDEVCLQIRQHKPFSFVVAECKRLRAMFEAYTVANSYDNAAHIVPCVLNLLEVMLEDAVDEYLADVLGGLVVVAIGRCLGAGMDIVFYEHKPMLATMLVALLRKSCGDRYEDSTRLLVSMAEDQQRAKEKAVAGETMSSWENALGLSEIHQNASESTLKQWVSNEFCVSSAAVGADGDGGGGAFSRGGGDSTATTVAGSAASVPVVLPSMTCEEYEYAHTHGFPQPGMMDENGKTREALVKKAPFAAHNQQLTALLPSVIGQHKAAFMEILMPAEFRKQGGLYSCIAAVMATMADLDLLSAIKTHHFPNDCNDNVAIMCIGKAPSSTNGIVERCDRNGYVGHSSGYTMALCHAVKAVRTELSLVFPQIPLACEEVSDLMTLLLFKAPQLGGGGGGGGAASSLENLTDELLKQPFVPKPQALVRAIGLDRGDFDSEAAQQSVEEDEDFASYRQRQLRGEAITASLQRKMGLSTLFESGAEEMASTAQRLWPAILTALSIGSHILNDGTCWTTPILTPFENVLFESLQQDLLDIIISACHMLWCLPAALSGPLLCRVMADFSSVLRRSSASWFDLIGVGSKEAKSRLTQAATAVMITKSIPRRPPSSTPGSSHHRQAEGDHSSAGGERGGDSSSSFIPPPPTVFVNTDHLLHAPIDWMMRASSVGGAVAEHAILLEMHLFYCCSIFWLDPFWWTRTRRSNGVLQALSVGAGVSTTAASGGGGSATNAATASALLGEGNGVFAGTWTAINAAAQSVKELMPSPSPALLLWESICRVTTAYASLQQGRARPNERVYLAVRSYEAICRQRQQAGLVMQSHGGIRFLASAAEESGGNQVVSPEMDGGLCAATSSALSSKRAGPTSASLAIHTTCIMRLADGVDGWEDYSSYYSGTPTVSVSRKAQCAAMVEEVLPCLVYVLDWMGLEIISRRLQTASQCASLLAEQLSYMGAPLSITNALAQLAVAILTVSGGRANVREVVAAMASHFSTSIYRRYDLSSAGYSTPLMGLTDPFVEATKPHHFDGGGGAGKRHYGHPAAANATVVTMTPYKGEARNAYDFVRDGGADGGSVAVNDENSPYHGGPRDYAPSATPLGLSNNRQQQQYGGKQADEENSSNATMPWPEVRQVSRLVSGGALGAGANPLRRLQRLQNGSRSGTPRRGGGGGSRADPNVDGLNSSISNGDVNGEGAIVAKRTDVLDMIAKAYS